MFSGPSLDGEGNDNQALNIRGWRDRGEQKEVAHGPKDGPEVRLPRRSDGCFQLPVSNCGERGWLWGRRIKGSASPGGSQWCRSLHCEGEPGRHNTFVTVFTSDCRSHVLNPRYSWMRGPGLLSWGRAFPTGVWTVCLRRSCPFQQQDLRLHFHTDCLKDNPLLFLLVCTKLT